MIRYIVFDTETTGLDPLSGDKIIEIGAIELLDKQQTGKTYHQFINPEKAISQETIKITNITNEKLADKPIFKDIANDFLSFLNDNTSGCEKTYLVAHNASFDLKFLNHELKLVGLDNLSKFEVIDTLELARRKFPGQKATLDILCEKFGISLEKRRKEGHGALLDSQILVDVFIKLTNDNTNILEQNNNIDFVGIKQQINVIQQRLFKLTEQEEKEHINFLAKNKITW